MVKVSGPMMSMDASGSLGGAIVFSKWKGRNYVRQLVKPANPKSALQTSMRAMFKFLSQQWAGLASIDQTSWDAAAATLVASPFNAYMRLNQERWRNFLGASQVDPPDNTGTLASIGAMTATAGVRQITVTLPITTKGDVWAVTMHRSPTTTFTPSVSNCIAVIPITADGTSTTFVDTPLDPGAYFYMAQLYFAHGLLDNTTNEATATVT